LTEPIDIAFVEVVVRDQDLERLPKDVDKAARRAERNFEQEFTDKIDKHFGSTMKKMERDVDHFVDAGRKDFERLDNATHTSFTHIERDFDRTTRGMRRRVGELVDDFEHLGDNVDNRFGARLRRGLSQISTSFGAVVQNVGQLLGTLGGGLAKNPFAALIVALIPPIIALSGVIAQLIGLVGLLPSGLVVLAATIAPLVIAFHNFGDAVSALASGDLEKINEALKKLAPSARVVAREVANLLEPLRALQRAVQEAFFAPLIGGFAQLNNTLVPALSIGLSRVAGQLGVVLRRILDFLALPEQVAFFDKLFGAVERLVARFGPNLISFFEGFLNVAGAALPIFERLSNVMVDALGRFGQFMTEQAANGGLNDFIENAVTAAKELGHLLGALVHLFHTLFEGTRQSGHDLLNTLTDIIERLDEFLQTPAGQDALKELVIVIKAFGFILGTTVDLLIFSQQIFTNFLRALEKIGRGAKATVGFIGDVVPKAFGQIIDFIDGIPALLGTTLRNAFDSALVQFGIAIGLILFEVKNLPDLIVGFIASIPQRITNALGGVGPSVGGIFRDMVTNARDFVVNGFNDLVAFIESVPDRIKALGPLLLDAGRHIIEAFMNGLRRVGSFIGDVAGDIFGAVRGFLNKAIDKINVGIAKIDEILPGDLPRIPRLAEGALVKHRPGGTLVVAGEGNEDEVVAPLSKLEQGASITFGPGSINVNFSGAVPTTQEAADVGRAVGTGIISILTRRNIRAQVRSI